MDKKMTLQQKILAALANSTSRTPMSTAQVQAAVGAKRGTLTALEAMLAMHQVCSCVVIKQEKSSDWLTKPGTRISYWWLAGNVESKLLPQTAAANRKTKAARAAKGNK